MKSMSRSYLLPRPGAVLHGSARLGEPASRDSGDPRRAGCACGPMPMPGDVFVTSGQWTNGRHGLCSAQAMIMSPDTDTIRYAAAALVDLLPADAAVGTLRRVNPGGRGQRGSCRHAPVGGPSVGAPVPAGGLGGRPPG